MAIHDSAAQRLFVAAPLHEGAPVEASSPQAHYLLNVLRLTEGARVNVFNGRDGEWEAELQLATKRQCRFIVRKQLRPQSGGPEVDYLFAPLKHARLDYMVQKATELGVRRLVPVITRRTIAQRVNVERMRANVIEAAEQCGILRLPEVSEPATLPVALAALPLGQPLIFCDEEAPSGAPVSALAALQPGPIAVLVGPEGGFDPAERASVTARPGSIAISLGPRVMRADTAAVAALTLVNAVTGRGW